MHTFKTRQEFQNECNILCQLPTHENIIRMWAFFYDRANPDISPQFRKILGENARAISLFLLMDEHPTNMKEYMDLLVSDQGPEVNRTYVLYFTINYCINSQGQCFIDVEICFVVCVSWKITI